ncbi:F-box/kelch-repeat protein At3g06240-like [Bidens hawaiensis]|uniref:F-box/kelch-repeat protein At3g06240-like n=1 Tax=Bidens hawaiensis TaxID=980011 RepID=UPI00404A824E
MAELVFDVVEEILVRLDVKDVIRCKSVCKSWQSFISGPRFVKAHLNHNIKHDRDNRQLGLRRIHIGDVRLEDVVGRNHIHIVGSCNGLVCVSHRDAKFLVTNPSTRQQTKLQALRNKQSDNVRDFICWGFGYDSSSDDYKVIAGLWKGRGTNRTTFHVLTLKSNTWKVIGEVEFRNLDGKTGILCDGALYWFMSSDSKKVIISLDLSTEEFKEIPQPDDTSYKTMTAFFKHRLGVIRDYLCIYPYNNYSRVC